MLVSYAGLMQLGLAESFFQFPLQMLDLEVFESQFLQFDRVL